MTIRERIAQLFIIVVACCYLLNPFQDNIFVFFHNFSHQEATTFFLKKEQHASHDFLNIKSEKITHGHSHESLHEHKALSFFKTILDFDTSKDNPFTKNKIKYKFDKHIVVSNSFNKLVLKKDTTVHCYWFILEKITTPELNKTGPPPRSVFS